MKFGFLLLMVAALFLNDPLKTGKINRAKSDQLLATLMNKQYGFWSLTTDDIDGVRNQIADAFGIDRSTVVNH